MLIFLVLFVFPLPIQPCKTPQTVRPQLRPLPSPSLTQSLRERPRGSSSRVPPLPQMGRLQEPDVLCLKKSFCTDPPNYPDKQVTRPTIFKQSCIIHIQERLGTWVIPIGYAPSNDTCRIELFRLFVAFLDALASLESTVVGQ